VPPSPRPRAVPRAPTRVRSSIIASIDPQVRARTVELSGELAHRLDTLSSREGRPAEAVVSDALDRYAGFSRLRARVARPPAFAIVSSDFVD